MHNFSLLEILIGGAGAAVVIAIFIFALKKSNKNVAEKLSKMPAEVVEQLKATPYETYNEGKDNYLEAAYIFGVEEKSSGKAKISLVFCDHLFEPETTPAINRSLKLSKEEYEAKHVKEGDIVKVIMHFKDGLASPIGII